MAAENEFLSFAMFENTIIGRSRIFSASGWSVSCQAGLGLRSVPDRGLGPFECVELGYPSFGMRELEGWAEEPESPTETIYNRVPIELVAWLLAREGGRAPDPAPGKAQKGLVAVERGIWAPVLGNPQSMAAKARSWAQAACLGSALEELESRFVEPSLWPQALDLLVELGAPHVSGRSDWPGLLDSWASGCEALILDMSAIETPRKLRMGGSHL